MGAKTGFLKVMTPSNSDPLLEISPAVVWIEGGSNTLLC